MRKYPGENFHELAKRKGCKIVKGHLMRDHVHICISIQLRYSVSNVVRYLKGKCAISIARKFKGKKRNFSGDHFWARGYFVTTVGLYEEVVRAYIQDQEKNDAGMQQHDLD